MEAMEPTNEQSGKLDSQSSESCSPDGDNEEQVQWDQNMESAGWHTTNTQWETGQAGLDQNAQSKQDKAALSHQSEVQADPSEDNEHNIHQCQNDQTDTQRHVDLCREQDQDSNYTDMETGSHNENTGVESYRANAAVLDQPDQHNIEDQYDQESQCSQFEEQSQTDERSQVESEQYQEAEEIVAKLCKNGKVMQFHEGEDFIKVIVYEDSDGAADPEETLSAEETESTLEGALTSDGRQQQQHDADPRTSKNLLDCLLVNERVNIQQASDDSGPGPCKRSRSSLSTQGQMLEVIPDPSAEVTHHNTQWYQGLLSAQAEETSVVTPASAIQSNFAHTVNQFAPSFLTCNVADLDPTGAAPQLENTDQEKPKMYTPHHRNGFMYYVPDDVATPDSVPRCVPLATSSPAVTSNLPKAMQRCSKAAVNQSSVRLNSSGEENVSPMESQDTPTGIRHQQQQHQFSKKVRSLIQFQENAIEDLGKVREQHNQKERKRRSRIKEACNLLRQLVPGMSDKTDKATVFEFAARYVHFLKSHTGTQYDKDFLMKYSPY